MNDEEGLQGSWFQGTITQLHHGFALIAYDELMVSENSDEKLQEWFPLPGTPEGHRALLEATHDSHFGSGFKIRPPPPPEVSCSSRGCIQAVLPWSSADQSHALVMCFCCCLPTRICFARIWFLDTGASRRSPFILELFSVAYHVVQTRQEHKSN